MQRLRLSSHFCCTHGLIQCNVFAYLTMSVVLMGLIQCNVFAYLAMSVAFAA